MINYGRHFIDSNDTRAVLKVLKSNNLTQGSQIINFEKELNNYFGSKYACVVNNGTGALYILSDILEWEKNDVIFCSPISFMAGSNSILRRGAKPFFIDIEKLSYNIDPNIIEHKLKNKYIKKRAKAIIATDYAGHPCDWESLSYLANKHDLVLINDNCHSMGSAYLNKKNYAIKYADFVVQSYHAVKNFTCGEGGSILTNNKKKYEKIKSIRNHGIERSKKKYKEHGPWFYDMHILGSNYRLTDIQAALGISQIKKLDKFVSGKRKKAKLYKQHLKNLDYVTLPRESKDIKHSYHLFPVLIDFKKLKKNKKEMFRYFKKYEINLQTHYIPTYKFSFYKKLFNYDYKKFPNAENFYKNSFSLPIFYGIKNLDQIHIIRVLRNFLGK